MMASAVRSYLNRFAVRPGERVALFTNNDDGWRTAKALRKRGVDIAVIVDSRPEVSEHLKAQHPEARVIADARVSGTNAVPLLRAITVEARGGSERIEADTLAISGGWNPELGLTCRPRRPAGVERGFGSLRAGANATRTDCGRRRAGPHAAARLSHGRRRSGAQSGGGHGFRNVR